MDPKACLVSGFDAVQEEDVETAVAQLRLYRAWRHFGGFEPTIADVRGDLAAAQLKLAIDMVRAEQANLANASK
jgi:hypothetical protein